MPGDDATNAGTTDEQDLSRRSVLKKSAAVGAGVGAMAADTTTGAASVDETVTELRGREWQQTLKTVGSDASANRLMERLVSEGYTPEIADAAVTESRHGGQEWRSALIPFSRGGDEQTVLAWTGNPEIDEQVAAFNYVPRASGDGWSVTKYTATNGELSTTYNPLLYEPPGMNCDVDWWCVWRYIWKSGYYASACYSCALGLLYWCDNCVRYIASDPSINCDACH